MHFKAEEIGPLLQPVAATTGGHHGVNPSLIADKRPRLGAALAAAPASFRHGRTSRPSTSQSKAVGATVLWTVGTPENVVRAASSRVDILVAQGIEGGGRPPGGQGTDHTELPTIVRAANGLPVVSAGGIGTGIAAALVLSAEGVWLGVRFVASTEVDLHDGCKDRVMAAGADEAVATKVFEIGWPDLPHPVLNNETIAAWKRAGFATSLRPSARRSPTL